MKDKMKIKMPFGKHINKTIREILVREPDYVRWIIELKNTYGSMEYFQKLFRELVLLFNTTHTEKCIRCGFDASSLSFYMGNPTDPYFWCYKCVKERPGGFADPGKLVYSKINYFSILGNLHRRYMDNRGRLRKLATKAEIRKIYTGLFKGKGM